jgi:carboxymethylenebutenolidase
VISRREFFDGVAKYAVGGITATALAESLLPRYAEANQVEPDDPRLATEYITYDSPNGGGTIRSLLARPAAATGPLPGIVVVHENRGLNPYIEDVTRRAALAGYIALGPDALTPLGGYPGTDDEGREMQATRDREEMNQDFIAAVEYLQAHKDSTGKVGVTGFCFGGGIANMLAVRVSDLGAAAPFYGRQPTAEEAASINAPLLIHYAGLDDRVNAGWPDYEAALKSAGKEYTAYIYDDTNHGFHNDSTPRYDEAAAKLAWERTIAFFDANLKS